MTGKAVRPRFAPREKTTNPTVVIGGMCPRMPSSLDALELFVLDSTFVLAILTGNGKMRSTGVPRPAVSVKGATQRPELKRA